MSIRTITFQVTEACQLACKYCYQGGKTGRAMNRETASKVIDLLFDERGQGFIDEKVDHIQLGFIGGEPLLEIDLIRFVCDYFAQKCRELGHPWGEHWNATLTTNGVLYFDPRVQSFLEEYRGHLNFHISVDGPREMHDSCRTFRDGGGSFEQAYAAMRDYAQRFDPDFQPIVTLSPQNIERFFDIVQFFAEAGMKSVAVSVVKDAEWQPGHGRLFYQELKRMADFLLAQDDPIEVSIFQEGLFVPQEAGEMENACGVNGYMVAFDPEGIAYPCLRFMQTTLCGERESITIGDADRGLVVTPEEQANMVALRSITRDTHSPKHCLDCLISRGCGWCVAWDYKLYGTLVDRCTYYCVMHRARSLGNAYYWNKLYRKRGAGARQPVNLPEEDALKIIDLKEFEMLKELAGEE